MLQVGLARRGTGTSPLLESRGSHGVWRRERGTLSRITTEYQSPPKSQQLLQRVLMLKKIASGVNVKKNCIGWSRERTTLSRMRTSLLQKSIDISDQPEQLACVWFPDHCGLGWLHTSIPVFWVGLNPPCLLCLMRWVRHSFLFGFVVVVEVERNGMDVILQLFLGHLSFVGLTCWPLFYFPFFPVCLLPRLAISATMLLTFPVCLFLPFLYLLLIRLVFCF